MNPRAIRASEASFSSMSRAQGLSDAVPKYQTRPNQGEDSWQLRRCAGGDDAWGSVRHGAHSSPEFWKGFGHLS